jgi:hypothetical protein
MFMLVTYISDEEYVISDPIIDEFNNRKRPE